MANVGTHVENQNTLVAVRAATPDDNDVVIELADASRFDTFSLMSTAGAMDVDVSLDGTNFAVAIAITDEKTTTPAVKVIVTAPGLLYSFRGNFKVVRIRQNGATDTANAALICGRRG